MSQEMTKTQTKPQENVADFLRKNMAMIESAAKGGILKPDRVLAFAINSIRNNHTLATCTKGSLLKAVLVSTQLGLVPDNILGEGYLVPFWSSKEKMFEAQFIVGYRGLIKLLFQAGFVIDVDPHVVYSGDQFEYSYGLSPVLIHKPSEGERGEIRGFYSVIRLSNGVSKFHYMSANEAKKHGERFSKSKSREGKIYGPWVEHFEAMALKTVIKRGTKYCPLSVDLVAALNSDEQREQGLAADLDIPTIDVSMPVNNGEIPQEATGGISGLERALNAEAVTEPESRAQSQEMTEEKPKAEGELFSKDEIEPAVPPPFDRGIPNPGKLPEVNQHVTVINKYLAESGSTLAAREKKLQKLISEACQTRNELGVYSKTTAKKPGDLPIPLAAAIAEEICERKSIPF